MPSPVRPSAARQVVSNWYAQLIFVEASFAHPPRRGVWAYAILHGRMPMPSAGGNARAERLQILQDREGQTGGGVVRRCAP